MAAVTKSTFEIDPWPITSKGSKTISGLLPDINNLLKAAKVELVQSVEGNDLASTFSLGSTYTRARAQLRLPLSTWNVFNGGLDESDAGKNIIYIAYTKGRAPIIGKRIFSQPTVTVDEGTQAVIPEQAFWATSVTERTATYIPLTLEKSGDRFTAKTVISVDENKAATIQDDDPAVYVYVLASRRGMKVKEILQNVAGSLIYGLFKSVPTFSGIHVENKPGTYTFERQTRASITLSFASQVKKQIVLGVVNYFLQDLSIPFALMYRDISTMTAYHNFSSVFKNTKNKGTLNPATGIIKGNAAGVIQDERSESLGLAAAISKINDTSGIESLEDVVYDGVKPLNDFQTLQTLASSALHGQSNLSLYGLTVEDSVTDGDLLERLKINVAIVLFSLSICGPGEYYQIKEKQCIKDVELANLKLETLAIDAPRPSAPSWYKPRAKGPVPTVQNQQTSQQQQQTSQQQQQTAQTQQTSQQSQQHSTSSVANPALWANYLNSLNNYYPRQRSPSRRRSRSRSRSRQRRKGSKARRRSTSRKRSRTSRKRSRTSRPRRRSGKRSVKKSPARRIRSRKRSPRY